MVGSDWVVVFASVVGSDSDVGSGFDSVVTPSPTQQSMIMSSLWSQSGLVLKVQPNSKSQFTSSSATEYPLCTSLYLCICRGFLS